MGVGVARPPPCTRPTHWPRAPQISMPVLSHSIRSLTPLFKPISAHSFNPQPQHPFPIMAAAAPHQTRACNGAFPPSRVSAPPPPQGHAEATPAVNECGSGKSTKVTVVQSFDDMGLKDDLLVRGRVAAAGAPAWRRRVVSRNCCREGHADHPHPGHARGSTLCWAVARKTNCSHCTVLTLAPPPQRGIVGA